MSYSDYSKYFVEHHNGPFHGVAFFTRPTKPLRDANLSDAKQQDLKDIMMASERGQNKILTLHNKSNVQRALLLNSAAYHLARPVCYVSCPSFVEHYIGETEKNVSSLLARGETKKWILFFDEADALFGVYSTEEKGNKEILDLRLAYLIKTLSSYPGLVVLSLYTRSCLKRLFFASDRFEPLPK
jgi:SpoVK/Ycf46/Vps4 family AAA+-type ATPase